MLYRCLGLSLTLAAIGCGKVASTSLDAAPGDGGGDGVAADAPIDTPPDAPPLPRIYDIAYGSTWEFNVDQAMTGWITIVNTGTGALDLSTLRVTGVSDQHPTMNLTAVAGRVTTRLQPGQVGGNLTPVSRRVTVDAGLITAPTVDTTTNYVSFELLNFTDAADVTFNGTITLEIASRPVELPLTFHVSPLTGPILFEPSLGRRVSAP